jgi:hypothetical protein
MQEATEEVFEAAGEGSSQSFRDVLRLELPPEKRQPRLGFTVTTRVAIRNTVSENVESISSDVFVDRLCVVAHWRSPLVMSLSGRRWFSSLRWSLPLSASPPHGNEMEWRANSMSLCLNTQRQTCIS